MRDRRVPLRRSLIVRLLVTSVLVAVAAISATAWLAVQSTTRAIQQEQGRSLADDTSIYDALIEYAATHNSWSDVGPVVQELAARTGRRVTLMTSDRLPLTDSGTGPSLAAARPSAIVDPLNVDPGLARVADGSSIDPRAVGPYRLTADERSDLRKQADAQVSCMKTYRVTGEVAESPSGRPTVRTINDDPKQAALHCGDLELRLPVKSEEKALTALTALVNACLGADVRRNLQILPDFGYRFFPLGSKITENDVRRCLESSRREQLKTHVAAPALLFVTDPAKGPEPPAINLSRENALRIAGVTGLVLLLAVAITILVGVRLVRPLRALTEAARRPADHQQRVPVTTRDEIGYLATALNDLSDRREQLEQQRKAMVSDVAHELRTPLTNIRSWLEAAQDGVTPVDPQLLELLLEEAVLLQHVIDDLRDLAAADAGNLRVHPESVYVNDALAQVVEAHRGAAEAAGVHLGAEVHGDPEVVVDPNRLRQMVGNLVSNAVRHTPRGGSVTLRSRVDGAKLIVDVVDTGVGIAPADLARVFDRFWRADASRSRATGGSGLGLAIARKLAQAHGGDIGVTSRPGTGSVFTVKLPA
jgi:two-component system sensor histidine kinase BaeS